MIIISPMQLLEHHAHWISAFSAYSSWSDLKIKLQDEEGCDQLFEKIGQLKLESSVVINMQLTVLTPKQCFVLFNSIPKPINKLKIKYII